METLLSEQQLSNRCGLCGCCGSGIIAHCSMQPSAQDRVFSIGALCVRVFGSVRFIVMEETHAVRWWYAHGGNGNWRTMVCACKERILYIRVPMYIVYLSIEDEGMVKNERKKKKKPVFTCVLLRTSPRNLRRRRRRRRQQQAAKRKGNIIFVCAVLLCGSGMAWVLKENT